MVEISTDTLQAKQTLDGIVISVQMPTLAASDHVRGPRLSHRACDSPLFILPRRAIIIFVQ